MLTGCAATNLSSASPTRPATRISARCWTGKEIDAVVVGTPDHNHAYCALTCMQAGKHVYVEKPLTRTAGEARLLWQAARKYNVATQMGNQGYSHDATRVACEIIWSGEIGEVREVHAWTGRPIWPQEMTRIPPPTPVPATLDWDLWLGVAAARPFTVGDEDYQSFVAAREARNRPPGMPQGFRYRPGYVQILSALQLARLLRFRQQPDWRLGRSHSRSGELGPATRSGVPDEHRVY